MSFRLVSRAVLAALIVLSVDGAGAAVPKKPSSIAVAYPTTVSLDSTRSALSMPMTNRMQLLHSQGPAGYRNLVAIMFNSKESMDNRWRSVTAAGRIGGEHARPELERALKAKEWYMRNAALVAMTQIDRETTIRWARALLSDKALVVRAAAVEALGELKDAESSTLLWQKLYAKENYKGQQSLFIRRRILEALAKTEPRGREGKFIEALSDKDESLHPVAVFALEKMTQKRFGTMKEPVRAKRVYWQQWWREQGQARASM